MSDMEQPKEDSPEIKRALAEAAEVVGLGPGLDMSDIRSKRLLVRNYADREG